MNPQEVSDYMEHKTAELLGKLDVDGGVQVDVLIVEDRKYLDVKINAPESGSELIGYHGNRLKSLSAVLGMMLPHTEERYAILLDVNGYREKRGEYIREVTQKAIDQATEIAQEVRLQPMDAWERRIVHMEVGKRSDVTSISEGEGEDRRVVIKPASVV